MKHIFLLSTILFFLSSQGLRMQASNTESDNKQRQRFTRAEYNKLVKLGKKMENENLDDLEVARKIFGEDMRNHTKKSFNKKKKELRVKYHPDTNDKNDKDLQKMAGEAFNIVNNAIKVIENRRDFLTGDGGVLHYKLFRAAISSHLEEFYPRTKKTHTDFLQLFSKQEYKDKEGKSMVDRYIKDGVPSAVPQFIAFVRLNMPENGESVIEKTLNQTDAEDRTLLYRLLTKKEKDHNDFYNIFALLETPGVDVNKHPLNGSMPIELFLQLTEDMLVKISGIPTVFRKHTSTGIESFRERGLDENGLKCLADWERSEKIKREIIGSLLILITAVCTGALCVHWWKLMKNVVDTHEKFLVEYKKAQKDFRQKPKEAQEEFIATK